MRWDLTVLIALKPGKFGEEEGENRMGKILLQETSLRLDLRKGGVLAQSYFYLRHLRLN